MSFLPSNPNLTFCLNERNPDATDILPYCLSSPLTPSSSLTSAQSTLCPCLRPLLLRLNKLIIKEGDGWISTPHQHLPVAALSSKISSIIRSSPICGQGSAKKESMKQKAEKAKTEAAHLHLQVCQLAKAQKEVECQEALCTVQEVWDLTVRNILKFIKSQKMTLEGFLVEVFNNSKWKGMCSTIFFNINDCICWVLNLWTSFRNKQVLEALEMWVYRFLVKIASEKTYLALAALGSFRVLWGTSKSSEKGIFSQISGQRGR